MNSKFVPSDTTYHSLSLEDLKKSFPPLFFANFDLLHFIHHMNNESLNELFNYFVKEGDKKSIIPSKIFELLLKNSL